MNTLLTALAITQAVVAGIPKSLEGKCIESSRLGIRGAVVVDTQYGKQLQFYQKGGEVAFKGVIEGTVTVPPKVILVSREAVTISANAGTQEIWDFWKECQE